VRDLVSHIIFLFLHLTNLRHTMPGCVIWIFLEKALGIEIARILRRSHKEI